MVYISKNNEKFSTINIEVSLNRVERRPDKLVSRSIGHDTIFRRTNAAGYYLKTPIIWPSTLNKVRKKNFIVQFDLPHRLKPNRHPMKPNSTLGSRPLSIFPICRAMRVFPVPGGPNSRRPFTCGIPNLQTFPNWKPVRCIHLRPPAGKWAIQDSKLLSAASLMHALWLHDSLYLGSYLRSYIYAPLFKPSDHITNHTILLSGINLIWSQLKERLIMEVHHHWCSQTPKFQCSQTCNTICWSI